MSFKDLKLIFHTDFLYFMYTMLHIIQINK